MTISYLTAGTKAITGTTDQLVFHPATVAADRMMIVSRCIYFGTATFVTPAGFIAGGNLNGGVNLATDDHTTRCGTFTRVTDGSEASSNTNFQAATTPTGAASVSEIYSKDASRGWATPVSVTGTDNTHGANRSVTSGSTLNLAPGDMVHIAVAVDTDTNITITAPAISSTGITFSAVSARTGGAGATTGSDGNIRTFSAVVNSGTGTNTVTFSFTTATSQCGPVVFTRLREQGYVMTIEDNVGITDAGLTLDFIPGGTSHVETPVDNVGITDTVQLDRGLARQDNVGITDNIALDRGLVKSENIGITDLVTKEFGKSLVDDMGITDTVIIEKGRFETITDNVGITDSVAFDKTANRTDNVGITDNIAIDRHMVITDSVGITDNTSMVVPVGVLANDTVGITDEVFIELEFTGKDSNVSLVDEKRDLAIAYLVAQAVDTEVNLRLLSIHDLAHMYWSHKAGDFATRHLVSVHDHMEDFDPTKEGWDWLTDIV